MVQKEIFSILKEVVQKDVVSDVNGSDIPYFTVKADGTRFHFSWVGKLRMEGPLLLLAA